LIGNRKTDIFCQLMLVDRVIGTQHSRDTSDRRSCLGYTLATTADDKDIHVATQLLRSGYSI
jgi:hypothetical protein